MNSKQWWLSHKDWLKGLLMTALGAACGVVYTAIQGGGEINWRVVGATALSSGLSYIIKQLGTNEKGETLPQVFKGKL